MPPGGVGSALVHLALALPVTSRPRPPVLSPSPPDRNTSSFCSAQGAWLPGTRPQWLLLLSLQYLRTVSEEQGPGPTAQAMETHRNDSTIHNPRDLGTVLNGPKA